MAAAVAKPITVKKISKIDYIPFESVEDALAAFKRKQTGQIKDNPKPSQYTIQDNNNHSGKLEMDLVEDDQGRVFVTRIDPTRDNKYKRFMEFAEEIGYANYLEYDLRSMPLFHSDDGSPVNAMQIAQEVFNHPRYGLFLHGEPGTRKTTLAFAIAKYAILEFGWNVWLQPWKAWLNVLKETFRNDKAKSERVRKEQISDHLKKLSNKNLLIIDELARSGRHTASEFEQDILHMVLCQSEQRRIPLIVTSNHPPERMSKLFDKAIADRLTNNYRMVEKSFDKEKPFRKIVE